MAASLIIVWFIGVAMNNLSVEHEDGIADSYVPECQESDVVCSAWTHFRQLHPYPYQSIAANREPDGSLVLIISEPPPSLSKDSLHEAVQTIFGDSLISSKRLRWGIGTDGWVEDLVLKIKGNDVAQSAPIKDGIFLDRIGMLDEALYGTTFGGGFERLDAPSSTAWTNTASNLDVSSREIRTWLGDDTLTWQSVNYDGDPHFSWADICKRSLFGTFRSSDNSLVMLTFPTSMLIKTQKDPSAFGSFQIPFREFAVSSQSVFGGVWQVHGQTAILGRIRTQPVNELPPLRFETFALLAARPEDELSQSYERNAIFAGKLMTGAYIHKDWAPVYLSGALIDTELGALLNITDQMLKSWSQAGNVEYLYFTYPKPGTFPFDNQALLDVLKKKLKTHEVLFNWNTSGSAVIVEGAPFSVLVARETGALPVTYGANGRPASQGGENVFGYEEEAYKYFAGLHNPNLARVVQYTVLYQLFRAIAKDVAANQHDAAPTTITPSIIPARAAAATLMTNATVKLIDDLDRQRLTEPHDLIQNEVLPKLRLVRIKNQNLTNGQLARLLSDRFSPETLSYEQARQSSLKEKAQQFETLENALHQDAEVYNRDLERVKASSSPDEMASVLKLEERSDSIKARRTMLDQQENEFQREAQDDAVENLRKSLHILALDERVANLDAIRMKFIESNNQTASKGSIKTPSVVLSWNRRGELSITGGHNLDSRAIRFEPSADVSGITLRHKDGVTVVRYNPAQADAVESQAGILAREIEHGQEEILWCSRS